MRLLLVGNGIARHRALQDALRDGAALFDLAIDFDEARHFLHMCDYDLVVMGLDAEAIRRLRAAGFRQPLVAAQIDEPDTAIADAYHAGADAVLAAGCAPPTIWAQLVAAARRGQGHEAPVLSAGEVSLDIQLGSVTVAGAPLRLPRKERAVLELLLLRRGRLVTKESLMARLYDGMDEPGIKIVDVMVCKLRKKLATAGVRDLIRTSWGQGYMVAA